MDLKKYKVTCLNCKRSNTALITEIRQNEFMINLDEDHRRNNNFAIISGRYRPDMQFGWECICRNTSIICNQEVKSKDDIRAITPRGGEAEIERLAKSLTIRDDKKFLMEEA